MRRVVVFYVICPILMLGISSLTYAEIASVDADLQVLSAWDDYDAPTSPVSSYSYSQVGTSSVSDSDAGSYVSPIGWLAQSESSVQTQQGKAYTTSLDDPFLALAAAGNAILSLNESVNASSSTMVFNNYHANNNDSVNFSFTYFNNFNVPTGIQAEVTYRYAVWKWNDQTPDLILNPMAGWFVNSLATPMGTLPVIEKTYTTGLDDWILVDYNNMSLQMNGDYTYFFQIDTELMPVPEPVSLFLFALGGISVIIKRRH